MSAIIHSTFTFILDSQHLSFNYIQGPGTSEHLSPEGKKCLHFSKLHNDPSISKEHGIQT